MMRPEEQAILLLLELFAPSDKDCTALEAANAQIQRVNVRGEDFIYFDFYTARGTPGGQKLFSVRVNAKTGMVRNKLPADAAVPEFNPFPPEKKVW